MNRAVHAGLALLMMMLGVSACTGILGSFDYTGTGGKGGTGGTTTTTSTTNACPGGAMECSATMPCSEQASACVANTCDNGCCGTEKTAAETACTDSSGRVCDGDGHCVACVQQGDCPAQSTVCLVNACSGNACSTTNAPKSTTCNDGNGKLCDGNGKCAACLATTDCPVPTTLCVIAACTSEACTTSNATLGTTCTDSSGAFCDGNGKCVQCNTTADCAAPLGCVMNKCVPASCSDSVKDGNETDVDCGGPVCGQCGAGLMCSVNADCTSGYCKAGVCAVASCTDQVQDGNETDVDCGGSCTAKCADGKHCGVAGDCANNDCFGGVCISCTDGAKDGNETDVDCGGSCTTKCADFKHCTVATDCANNDCAGGVCISCADGVKDGTETDVDCGGSCTTKCADRKHCSVSADCVNGNCYGGICVSCMDAVKDGTETDVDCGGAGCPACAYSRTCLVNSDCASTFCVGSPLTCDGVVLASVAPAYLSGGIAVDSANVYFTPGAGTGYVWSVSLTGGTVTNFSLSEFSPSGVAVVGSNVLWTDGNAMLKQATSGPPLTTVGMGMQNGAGVTTDGFAVYWADFGNSTGMGAGTITKSPIGSPAPVTLATNLNGPFRVAVDMSGWVYWTNYGDGTVMKVTNTGTSQTTLATGLTHPRGIATDGQYVYYCDPFKNLWKLAVGGGTPTSLSTDCTEVTIDATYVYFTSQLYGLVRKVAKTGGAVTNLASANTAYPITNDTNFVYWTNYGDSTVRKVHK